MKRSTQGEAGPCPRCGSHFTADEPYLVDGARLCEPCAIDAGLYPLGHTGARRDPIAEKGRLLGAPKPKGTDRS